MPMHRLTECLLAALALSSGVVAAVAHDLKYLESELKKREAYFQTINRPAPMFALLDAEGRRVGLDDLRGKVVVLNFIYASCTDVCPLHSELLAEVQSLVNRTPMKDLVQFISVTTDPEKDTPEVLRAYGAIHGLDPANWAFLTRDPAQSEDITRRLAEAYGHKFMPTDGGQQVHGVVTHVIDREGQWRGNFHGLGFQPTNLVLYLNALVNDVHAPAPQQRAPSLWERLRSLF